jgi:hypothetical protein
MNRKTWPRKALATLARMPLQNRVTPFGEIVAIEQRGLFMGNRGIIHDPATRTLLGRRWTNKAWIICRCEFCGVRRQVMSRRSWAELFFFDEATALAAGHRPCFFCRRESALAFARAWAHAHGLARPSAAGIDATLHVQRLQDGQKRIHRLRTPVARLPDGAVIAVSGNAYVIASGLAFRWSASGYHAPRRLARADGLLTPPATVAVLRAGYSCVLHPTLARWIGPLAGQVRDVKSATVRRPRSATRK